MSRPPQVRVRFFSPMIPDLAGSGRRIYSLVSVPHRASPSPAGSPHSTAYYPLLVHRHGILPRPSFGPHLAVGTLVSANGSCGQARKGLSPSRFAPCWAHRPCERGSAVLGRCGGRSSPAPSPNRVHPGRDIVPHPCKWHAGRRSTRPAIMSGCRGPFFTTACRICPLDAHGRVRLPCAS